MSLNSLLLKMLLSSDTPILLISEKMLMDEEDTELEKALMEQPKSQTQIVPYVS